MKHPETAKRLNYMLNKRQMTAQELSNKSGVGKSSISHYVNGSHEPQNINARAMADVLKCNPEWLMGFNVPMEQLSNITSHNNDSAFIKKMKALESKMNDVQLNNVLSYAQWLSSAKEKEGDENVMD